MKTSRQITVRVLKYDGAEHRRWTARLARREGSLLVLDAEFDIDVDHSLLGEIRRGTRTEEFYWLDRWYNVFRFLEDDGESRLFYCNINTPAILRDNVLSYTDLDIDIMVQPDLSYQVLDTDEFEANANRYSYSEEVKASALAALHELIEMIRAGEFPFKISSASSVVNYQS